MKLDKQKTFYVLSVVLFLGACYAIFIRHDLLLTWGIQFVWLVLVLIQPKGKLGHYPTPT